MASFQPESPLVEKSGFAESKNIVHSLTVRLDTTAVVTDTYVKDRAVVKADSLAGLTRSTDPAASATVLFSNIEL